jgi:uncharacterized protein (TIGR02284 family)
MADDINDDLVSLYNRAVDARHGYEEALAQAEGKGLTRLFRELIDIHTRNGEELSAYLIGIGHRPDDEGTFMSTVHRTIMDVRSVFGGLGESVLPGLIDGEERNVEKYDDVLQRTDVAAPLKGELARQKGRLESVLTAMKHPGAHEIRDAKVSGDF